MDSRTVETERIPAKLTMRKMANRNDPRIFKTGIEGDYNRFKFEIRNSKYEINLKLKLLKFKNIYCLFEFRILNLFRISDLVFRA